MAKPIAQIRDSLRADRLALQQEYEKSPQPSRLLRAHSKLIDHYLTQIWLQHDMPVGSCLVAVGGYGRGELFPKSDIDLLILLAEPADRTLEIRLQDLIGCLWDVGLEIGHSIRTIGDCMAESSDVTVQTNLLEARRITGNAELFVEMRETLSNHLSRRAFFWQKPKSNDSVMCAMPTLISIWNPISRKAPAVCVICKLCCGFRVPAV